MTEQRAQAQADYCHFLPGAPGLGDDRTQIALPREEVHASECAGAFADAAVVEPPDAITGTAQLAGDAHPSRVTVGALQAHWSAQNDIAARLAARLSDRDEQLILGDRQ